MKQLTLNDLDQSIAPETLHDSQFMTAAEKSKVLKQWERFLSNGLAKEYFTRALYKHLINHCSFIAHYDIHGFYSTYFERGDDIRHFLSQFDTRRGPPRSIEYGWTPCITGEAYSNNKAEVCRIACKYIPALELKARNDQRHADIAVARALLRKHRINLPEGGE